MNLFQASHLKVHAALSWAVPGSKVFLRGFLLLAASMLLLAVSYFLQFHGLSDEHSMAC
jgi:hypothetical protein